MTTPATPPRRNAVCPVLAVALIAVLATAAYAFWRMEQSLTEQARQLAETRTSVEQVLGEVTRLRIEQSAGIKGPQALLEKLSVYAPLVASARITEPDYQNARKEMAAIMRAFVSIGKDAWQPIMNRLEKLDAHRDSEEIRQLLEAAMAVDEKAGKQILKEVLLGQRLPAPKLRWSAARILTERDKPLAQQMLRQVLLTESHLGVNPQRAASEHLPIPDAAAIANTGFNNFVVAYIRTDDPQMEDTLLMVLGRAEHDQITIQECIEELGRRRCQRAVAPIKHLYQNPPLHNQNPLFLNHCLTALVEIQHADAKPFLEQCLANPATDVVARQIQFLLEKIRKDDFEDRRPLPAEQPTTK